MTSQDLRRLVLFDAKFTAVLRVRIFLPTRRKRAKTATGPYPLMVGAEVHA